jgi:hypothetical protein
MESNMWLSPPEEGKIQRLHPAAFTLRSFCHKNTARALTFNSARIEGNQSGESSSQHRAGQNQPWNF